MARRNDLSSQKISNFFHPKKAQKVNNNEDDSVVPQISQVVESHRVWRWNLGQVILFIRDPGVRSQIYEYPKEKWNEIRREYLKLGPYQWSLKCNDYPLTQAEGDKQKRRFNPSWCEKFHWLEYSPKKDRVYCLPCLLFEKNPPNVQHIL